MSESSSVDLMAKIERRDNVQILRALACVAVFVTHLGQVISLGGSLRVITDFGRYGVYLFFVISGFLAPESWERSKGCLSYWAKRAKRILPLYYSVVLYYFVSGTYIFKDVPIDETGLGWWRYIFFLSGMVKAKEAFWSNHGFLWTIPVFILFYLLMPVIMRYVNSFKRASILCVILYVYDMTLGLWANGNLEATSFILYCMLGVMAHYAVKEKKELSALTFCTVALLFLLVQSASMFFVSSVVFTMLVISSCDMTVNLKILKKGVNMISKYSFSIYLLHGIVFEDFIAGHSYPTWMILIIAVVGTFALVVLYHMIENAVYKCIKKTT